MKLKPIHILTKHLITALVLLFSVNTVFGQYADLKFEHFNTENGLPQNTITGIVKDKFGFMWFGTWSGLCRHDGYRFKVYRFDKKKTNSLVNNRVMNITKDRNQNLWVVTLNDSVLCKYRYETDDFERIPAAKVSKEFKRRLSRDFHLDHVAQNYKGYQWSMGRNQKDLVRKDLFTGNSKRYEANPLSPSSLNDALVTDMYLDNEHILWVGTYSNGINKTNLDAKPFQQINHNPLNPNSLIDNNVRSIAEDKQGNIWVGTRFKGITVISKNNIYRHIQWSANGLNNNSIKTIFCDSHGYVWIGTLRGLNMYDPFKKVMRSFLNSDIKNNYVFVFDAYEDHLHQIWFASWNGIYKYIPSTDSLVLQKMPAMPSNTAMSIMEDRNRHIWIGTEGGGISTFKPLGNDRLQLVKQFRQSKNNSNSLSDDNVYCIYQDIDGMIWIGTGSGLNRFDPSTASFKLFLPNANVTKVVEDNSGSLWVSHNKGLLKINKRTLQIRNFSTQDGLKGNDFTDGSIFKSPSKGKLFFGGNNGINIFYPDSIRPNRNVPKIFLTELQILNKVVRIKDTVNGRVLLHKPFYLTSEIDLNYQDKSIAIEFSGLHFANPSGIKYAYMLEGFDKNWIYTNAENRIAAYSNLSRGNYIFKVKAANSDGIWNPVPATLKINVLPPFWASTAAYIFYAIIFSGLLYAFYYYSLRYAKLKSKLGYENLLQEKELEMRQSKIEFFTNISHEIKTPLSLILTPIDQLQTENKDNPKIIKQLKTIKNSGDRLLKLINQLLDIRRFETGNDKLNLQKTDLVVLLQTIVDSFSPMAIDKFIDLKFISSIEQLTETIDVDKIEKVLYNLLSNAFKFTPKFGQITLTLKYQNNNIIISVTDNGSGIPNGELETIFKPFQQASTNKSGGTGLGLAYARALVELHDGTIHAESFSGTDGQKRTIFTVKLPSRLIDVPIDNAVVSTEEEITASNLEIIDEQKIDAKALTVLIVEDNLELRTYLCDFFSATYTILEAENGSKGLELANEYIPDLIISDLMMTEMDGLELCKQIKTATMTSHIPFILLTAKSLIESQIEGITIGADDYITKPFNLELISLKVRNLFLSQIKQREKYRREINLQSSIEIPISPDDKLLKKVIEYVEKNIANPELDVESIGKDIGLSRSQLYRKMKALTDLSVGETIRNIRLKHASQLLLENKFNVSEVAYMVGFTDPDYFRKSFKAAFGVSPSKYKV